MGPVLFLTDDGSIGSFQNIHAVNTNDQNSCKNVLTKTTLHIGIKLAPWEELWKCSVKAPATMVTRIASVKNIAMKCQGKSHALVACSSDFTPVNYFFFI